MKSKKKLIVIILLLLIVVAGAAFAYLYFFTDMFKTPEQLFYKYAGKLAKSEESLSYQEMLDEIKTAQTKSYTGKTKIGVDLKAKGNVSNQAMYNVINGLGLEIETKSNPDEKKAEYNLNLNYGPTKITNLELVKDNDVYGVKSEFLDDKYVAVENKNLKSLITKLGGSASDIPNKIELLDIYDLLYVSKEDQDKIENTYKNIIKENVTQDKFKKEEIANSNTTAYSVELTQKEFQNLMLKLFETLKEDETMLNLLVDKLNMYLKANPAMQIMGEESFASAKLSKETLTQMLDNIIEDLNDNAQYADEKSTAKFTIYVSNEEVVKIEFKLNDETQMSADFYKTDDTNHIVVYAKDITYTRYNSYYGSSIKPYRKTSSELQKLMEIEYKKNQNGEEKNIAGKITAYEYDEELFKMGFDITTKGKTGVGKNVSNCKFDIDLDELSVGLTMDSEIEFTDNVKIVDLNSTNSTILNNMSKADIQKYFNKIGSSFESKLTKKMQSLGLMSTIPSLLYYVKKN